MCSFLYHFQGVLFSLSMFYLLACVDSEAQGYLPKLKVFLFETIPAFLKKVIGRFCGKRAVWLIERFFRYVFYEPNPIVQIIYFVLAGGGFYVYVAHGFIHLPNHRVSSYHIYIGSVLMLICYASYFAACWADPGILEKGNRGQLLKAVKRFKYDGILCEKKNNCRTCKFEKPARSKHCVVCNVCVEKMDHHCFWINNCTGLYNYRFFLVFIFLHAVICTYGSWLGYQILMSIVEKEKLVGATFSTNTGE
jgi:palmitoyltransferase ZDHHC4